MNQESDPMRVDTTKVNGRRTLRFESLADIAADIERLAAAKSVRSLGNWSPGQILKHLAIVMHGSIDGMEIQLPLFMRLLVPVMVFFFKQRFLNRPMPPGNVLPEAAAAKLTPQVVSWEEGLAAIRSGLERLQARPKLAKHPFMGKLTDEEWTKLQCRHSELHLSFVVGED